MLIGLTDSNLIDLSPLIDLNMNETEKWMLYQGLTS